MSLLIMSYIFRSIWTQAVCCLQPSSDWPSCAQPVTWSSAALSLSWLYPWPVASLLMVHHWQDVGPSYCHLLQGVQASSAASLKCQTKADQCGKAMPNCHYCFLIWAYSARPYSSCDETCLETRAEDFCYGLGLYSDSLSCSNTELGADDVRNEHL